MRSWHENEDLFTLRRPVLAAFAHLVGKRAWGFLILLLFAAPLFGRLPIQASGSCGTSTRAMIESRYDRWLDLVQRRDSLPDDAISAGADSLIDGLLALDPLAERILKDKWGDLTPHERTAFLEALTTSMRRGLLSFIEEQDPNELPAATYLEEKEKDGTTEFQYKLETQGDRKKMKFRVAEDGDGSCRIVALEYDGKKLADSYRSRVRHLLDKYSFPYMLGELGSYPYVVLEDFESSPIDELPIAWKWKDSDNDKNKPYRVVEEDGNKYLAANDEGESVILAKDIKWNLDEYPYVSFRWRVHEIPEGGDERTDDKVDSAAGIYFIYSKRLGLIPESAKYVWSSSLPVGSAVKRNGVGRPWQIVVGSGTEGMDEWHTYVLDLREAYKKTFGGDPPSGPLGIAILSDANSTQSHAYADYDDIRVLRTAGPEVSSGVEQILEAKSADE